ncbi:hypothetical protein [Mycobacterium sp.]|uniref:hypothetical protein n=1 Tax=Mycobacterium sp. TaxID=1785 RepID=UPI0031D7A987
MNDIALGGVIVCIAICVTLSSFKIGIETQRRIYWASVAVAAAFGAAMAYPKWATGLWIAGILLGAMTVAAYTTTPYIKIGGRIFALSLADSQSESKTATHSGDDIDPTPDSYGGMLSAAKMWWMLVVLAVIAGGNVYYAVIGREGGLIPWIGAAFITLAAIGIGYADGSWDYPVARRQYIQLVTASLVTAGGIAFLYLVAYYAARVHPLRREQSLEYRAHPRHQKRSAAD